ncbi:MAG: hypothetical protein U9N56_04500 [Actinomycetota bacterium]|nr:hypothetical protein [Actinomycetota bacterium]
MPDEHQADEELTPLQKARGILLLAALLVAVFLIAYNLVPSPVAETFYNVSTPCEAPGPCP